MDSVGRPGRCVTPPRRKKMRHDTGPCAYGYGHRCPASMNPERRKAIQQAMLRLADGDRTAMAGLVEQLWPVLWSYAERGLRDPQSAEDVAQEVLFRISARISELDRTRDPLSWAFGIATFEIMTQRKRRQRRRETLLAEAVTETTASLQSVEDAVMQAEVHAALTEALGQLSLEDVAHLGAPRSKRSRPPCLRHENYVRDLIERHLHSRVGREARIAVQRKDLHVARTIVTNHDEATGRIELEVAWPVSAARHRSLETEHA
jgi:RNA polymerase sigma-70 factor (ECF subfamily)